MIVHMDITDALKWVKRGIENGRYEAALKIIDDLLGQLEVRDKEEDKTQNKIDDGKLGV